MASTSKVYSVSITSFKDASETKSPTKEIADPLLQLHDIPNVTALYAQKDILYCGLANGSLISLQNDRSLRKRAHSEKISAICGSINKNQIYTAGFDGLVYKWDCDV